CRSSSIASPSNFKNHIILPSARKEVNILHINSELMRIKDELCGKTYEAVQLLPAREREVDLANHYHLWLRDDPTYRFPFGFTERLVSDVSINGAIQEPWPPDERPTDCLSAEEVHALMQRENTPQMDDKDH